MTGNSFHVHSNEDQAGREYFHHSSGQRINTDAVLVEALRKQYPHLELVVVPMGVTNLLAYAGAGHAKATPLEDAVHDPVYGVGVKWRSYMPPYRRFDGGPGAFVENILFGKFMYKWKDQEAILYVADGRDGGSYFPAVRNHYILTTNEHKVDELLKLAALWGSELHNEVWVFDAGYWQKSAELYRSVMNASWDNVILDEAMKKALINDVTNFFDGQKTYKDLQVPWKRGVIYYGPPGNGKTISIKATMHTLYQRGHETNDDRLTVPTLYVRTLASFGGPEFALRMIFSKARQEAPCYLVFEDLDSIVSDNVRSYFLNEVDGLTSNDGIMMVGSTNHLDRLDPGIAKRPSRFDRKYFFADPDEGQREQYARFWQKKLSSNKDVEFPDKLCGKIAGITKGFSFAYIQEAFVASLLAIAVRGGQTAEEMNRWSGPDDALAQLSSSPSMAARGGGGDDIEHLELWVEMQKQVKILREEMDQKVKESADVSAKNVRAPSMQADVQIPTRQRVGMGGEITRYRDELEALLGAREHEQQQQHGRGRGFEWRG
ncbi:P-loop containing nucleoside triphosphate hydrolase protein [Phaeosphaeria sp. MPI-PUGE-AT-0046c]|nr:P-loop containing nucleoside triphosphate hydrolase protein [Phaeosphaeria sp. MPI-PUGE-AT-0046c]